MKLDEFDFELPEELIATGPVRPRDRSRLLIVDRQSETLTHSHFYKIGDALKTGDLLVANNTRVLPARLLTKNSSGSEIEVFLLKNLSGNRWSCLVKPGKKIKNSLEVFLKDGSSAVLTRDGDSFFAELNPKGEFETWINQVGVPPLPPYIKRQASESDRSDYQTAFAKVLGSVAAPTAGLHFTPKLLASLKSKGIAIEETTLHVGYGTFAPIKTENIQDHVMHSEWFQLPDSLPDLMRATKENRGRVIAVGTTSLRALESSFEGKTSGETQIFISPGHSFRWIDGLITNFHLPKSSLFVLVSALMGLPLAQRAYREAVREKYRFFSYGDAMLIL